MVDEPTLRRRHPELRLGINVASMNVRRTRVIQRPPNLEVPHRVLAELLDDMHIHDSLSHTLALWTILPGASPKGWVRLYLQEFARSCGSPAPWHPASRPRQTDAARTPRRGTWPGWRCGTVASTRCPGRGCGLGRGVRGLRRARRRSWVAELQGQESQSQRQSQSQSRESSCRGTECVPAGCCATLLPCRAYRSWTFCEWLCFYAG
ncbi:hypothetical protein BDV95DRAFT_277661 [Massariosphaeria phaeospora]|uniref:Uncharacterized protein n=1 Tax=Massariosphaeria phaeospora TaxID=100035 RepID=A0A7C8MFB7_9PLEO|nr:hypothetical protein BDV95DRAFT_277661 [Massariosphaeria phaeospora]